MGWKDWSSWLKGGIIGGIIFCIYSLVMINIYSVIDRGNGIFETSINILFFIVYSPFKFLQTNIASNFYQYQIINAIIWIYFFIVGAIIGILINWLYGKIKGGKKK